MEAEAVDLEVDVVVDVVSSLLSDANWVSSELLLVSVLRPATEVSTRLVLVHPTYSGAEASPRIVLEVLWILTRVLLAVLLLSPMNWRVKLSTRICLP